ncbi:retrotransposon protein, putative, ty1-copia subclass [Tanacetum coccineum]
MYRVVVLGKQNIGEGSCGVSEGYSNVTKGQSVQGRRTEHPTKRRGGRNENTYISDSYDDAFTATSKEQFSSVDTPEVLLRTVALRHTTTFLKLCSLVKADIEKGEVTNISVDNIDIGDPSVEDFSWKLTQNLPGEELLQMADKGTKRKKPREGGMKREERKFKKYVKMAATAQNTNNTTIRSILQHEKLTGPNFTNWYRNLRIVLRRKDYDQFVQKYNMHSMEKTIAELHVMLKLHEKGIPKKAETPAVLAIREGKIQKDKRKSRWTKGKDKGNNKLAYAPKPKILSPPKRDNPTKDSICHHCKEVGHWRRNYSSYQAELKKRKEASMASTSVENQLGKKIKAIRSDRGGEYLSHEFVNHMKSCGIVSQLTPPYTPQHNEVSERRNQTLLDMVRSMMNLTTLPKSFWGYALESATRILNMVPTKKVERTPYKIWHGKAPKLSYLRVWGCEALVKRDASDKLDPRSIKYIFIGYPKETMGYYFYYPPENKIFVARNAEFFEDNLIVQEVSGSHGPLIMSGSDKGLELIQEEDTQPSENTSEEHNEVVPMEVEPQNVKVPIRRSARIPQAPDRYGFYVDVDEYELGDLNEPPNYKAALSDPEYDKWLEAMNTEMQSMKDNQVWILVELPPNGRTVRSKWLFKKKTDMDGNVHTFKARLVAKGYTQTYGVDYGETFSPVADIRAIRILLAIAAFYDYEIWQMDVKTAFLNGHLSEDVYMVQPEGFVDPKHPNKVCKLQRSIYGLKQASRSWNKRFDEEIKKIGFTQNPNEPCVYLKASGSSVAFLILYVDDILLMGNNVTMLQEVKSWLCKCFSMKDLGEAAYILGIKIIHDRS